MKVYHNNIKLSAVGLAANGNIGSPNPPANVITSEQMAAAWNITEYFHEDVPVAWMENLSKYQIVAPAPEYSIASMVKLRPDLFDSVQFQMYAEEFPEIAQLQLPDKWTALCIEAIPSSIGRSFKVQKKAVSSGNRVATAPEILWCLATIMAVQGNPTAPGFFLRSSSVDRRRGRIAISISARGVLHITRDPTDFAFTTFGLATVRK